MELFLMYIISQHFQYYPTFIINQLYFIPRLSVLGSFYQCMSCYNNNFCTFDCWVHCRKPFWYYERALKAACACLIQLAPSNYWIYYGLRTDVEGWLDPPLGGPPVRLSLGDWTPSWVVGHPSPPPPDRRASRDWVLKAHCTYQA